MAASTEKDLKRPVTQLTLRDREFCAWLHQAGAGDRVIYHRGHLAVDRMTGRSKFVERAREELERIADRAASLAEQGLLMLAQQRHAEGDFSYFAIKAGHRRPRGKNQLVDRYIGSKRPRQPMPNEAVHQEIRT